MSYERRERYDESRIAHNGMAAGLPTQLSGLREQIALKHLDENEVTGVSGTLRRQEVSRLATTIARVRELHQPMKRGPFTICAHCSGWDGEWRCRGVVTNWPCPTIAALDGKEAP